MLTVKAVAGKHFELKTKIRPKQHCLCLSLSPTTNPSHADSCMHSMNAHAPSHGVTPSGCPCALPTTRATVAESPVWLVLLWRTLSWRMHEHALSRGGDQRARPALNVVLARLSAHVGGHWPVPDLPAPLHRNSSRALMKASGSPRLFALLPELPTAVLEVVLCP